MWLKHLCHIGIGIWRSACYASCRAIRSRPTAIRHDRGYMTSANLTSNVLLSTPCFWNQCFCIDVANIVMTCKFQEVFSYAKMVWLHVLHLRACRWLLFCTCLPQDYAANYTCRQMWTIHIAVKSNDSYIRTGGQNATHNVTLRKAWHGRTCTRPAGEIMRTINSVLLAMPVRRLTHQLALPG